MLIRQACKDGIPAVMAARSIFRERFAADGPGHLIALGELAARATGDWPQDGEHVRELLSWPGTPTGQDAARQAKAELLQALHQRWSDLGERYALAIVSADTDPGSFDCVQSALALLRDVVAKRVLVIVPRGGPRALEPSDLGALGFGAAHLAEPEHGEPGDAHGSLLFCYDVATYKRTPDWLNPQGWAHPQRWGKFRW